MCVTWWCCLTDRFQLQRIKQGRAVDASTASASARTVTRCQLQTLLGTARPGQQVFVHGANNFGERAAAKLTPSRKFGKVNHALPDDGSRSTPLHKVSADLYAYITTRVEHSACQGPGYGHIDVQSRTSRIRRQPTGISDGADRCCSNPGGINAENQQNGVDPNVADVNRLFGLKSLSRQRRERGSSEKQRRCSKRLMVPTELGHTHVRSAQDYVASA